MKKLLLLLTFVLALATLYAQNGSQKSEMYEIMSHRMGYGFNIENFMRQHDGDFIFATFVSEQPAPGQWLGNDLGNMFYKMSATTLTITDSLFVDDPDAPYYLFAPNPTGEGNIRANFEYVEQCDSTFLRICHFPDNDLNIDHDDDILMPVCAGFAGGNFDSHMIDCRGDLIMKYTTIRPDGGYDEYIARFGTDGRLKHQALYTESQTMVVPKLRVFSESPLQYYQWRSNSEQNLSVVVMDSLFNKSNFIFNKVLSEVYVAPLVTVYEHLNFNVDTEVLPIGGNEILVAAQYTYDTNFDPMVAENGVAVAKYDIRTSQLKDYVVFNDYMGWTNNASCLGLKRMSDGTVYFLYNEVGYPDESFIAVKMDTDLNVEWKRFCKMSSIRFSDRVPLYFPILYEDGQGEEQGISWAAYGLDANDDSYLVYFQFNHDGIPASVENGMEVRPYAYYPNPAQDQLRLQYSPDVEPAQIELYDLQGRLVRSQGSGLECLNVQGLAAGQYVMKVTMTDGTTFADKVVKE